MFYQVREYPYFVAIKPNTGTDIASRFSYNQRNYNTMKRWIFEVLGDTPKVSPKKQQQKSAVVDDELQLKKFIEDVQQVMSDSFVKISDTQDMAFTDVLRTVSNRTFNSNKKLEEAIRSVE